MEFQSWGCSLEGVETASADCHIGPAPPSRLPYLALKCAQQPPFLAEGLEKVEQVEVGELPIEPLHSHVKARDHITAQFQGQSCLDGPSPALQG